MAIAWLLGQPSRRTQKPETNNQTEQPSPAPAAAPANENIPSWKDALLGRVRDHMEAPEADQHNFAFGLYSELKHAPLLGKERAIVDQWRVVIDRLRAIDAEAADLVSAWPINNHLIIDRYHNRGVPTP